jgi:nucleotide-binding universal stress UspA family protein
MYKRILVSTDGSELSDAAIKEAAKLAKESGAKLVLFHAAPHYHLSPLSEGFSAPGRTDERTLASEAMEAEAERILASAAKNVNLAGVALEQQFTVSNLPYEAIIEAAKKFQCELIVMASHGRRGLAGVLLGSETQKVLTHATIPVLVVR